MIASTSARVTFLTQAAALALGLLAAAAAAAAPAPPAPSAAAAPAADSWGPPAGGLAAAAALEGDAAVGGKIVLRIRLKSAAGQPVALPPAGQATGWALIVQSLGNTKKGFYSEKVPLEADLPAGAEGAWPAELAADKVLTLRPVDLGPRAAYASDAARELLTAYVGGKGPEALPKAAGRLADLLAPGRAMAKFTVCLPGAAGKPTLVTTAAIEMTVSPPALAALAPAARQAFLADLLKQFDRDAWSGQQAHHTAVRLGPDVLALVIPAAFETARPPHARLWLATTLADIPDDRCADALIRLLDDSMEGVRSVVAYHGPKQKSDRLDRAVLDKVRAGKDAGLAAWALLGFMVHRGAVPEEVVAAGLESEDPRARATAAETLARHANDENVARLTALLADRNERVRGTAAAVLGKSKADRPAVRAALVKSLDLPGEGARQKACAALSELTGREGPYDPRADAAEREKTLAAWKAWWTQKGGAR